MLHKTIMKRKCHPLKRATLMLELAEATINKNHYADRQNYEKAIFFKNIEIVKIKEIEKLCKKNVSK